jgi:hypothetical protein
VDPGINPYLNSLSNYGNRAYSDYQSQLGDLTGRVQQGRGFIDQNLNNAMFDAHALNKLAGQDQARYQDFYAPIENQLGDKSKWLMSAAGQNARAQGSNVDVTAAYDAARNNAQQALESYGIDPSQTRYAALDLGTRVDQARAMAGGAQAARGQARNEGIGIATNLAGMGQQTLNRSQQGRTAAAGISGDIASRRAGTDYYGAQTMGQPKGFLDTAVGAQDAAMRGKNTATDISFTNTRDQVKNQQDESRGFGQAVGSIAQTVLPLMFAADGGKIPNSASQDGSGMDDSVDAKLSGGEYVVPAHVVKVLGTQYFDKLVDKHGGAQDMRIKDTGQKPQGYAGGGPVAAKSGPPTNPADHLDYWMGLMPGAGMGAVSEAPLASRALQRIDDLRVKPTSTGGLTQNYRPYGIAQQHADEWIKDPQYEQFIERGDPLRATAEKPQGGNDNFSAWTRQMLDESSEGGVPDAQHYVSGRNMYPEDANAQQVLDRSKQYPGFPADQTNQLDKLANRQLTKSIFGRAVDSPFTQQGPR